jgi:hypothetical protein
MYANMNKPLIALLALVVLIGGYEGYKIMAKPATIADLVTYLQAQGLSVTPTIISPQEAEAVKNGNAEIAQFQAILNTHPDSSTQPVEDGVYDIGGIKSVHIYRFSSAEAAQGFYDQEEKVQTDSFAKALANGHAQDDKSEFLRARGNIVMRIDYYVIGVQFGRFGWIMDPSSIQAVNPPPADLAKLRSAVAGW